MILLALFVAPICLPANAGTSVYLNVVQKNAGAVIKLDEITSVF